MRYVCIWLFSAICIFIFSPANAADGEAIFKSQGCISCHRKESHSKVNPSLSEISQAYQGKENQLIKYLKGEADAIVRPEKSNLMKGKIEKMKNLSDADRKALADFILSH